MKKGMPLICLAGIGVFVFFLYALVNIGMDLNDLVTSHRGTIRNVLAVGYHFLNANKTMLALAAGAVVIARLFASAPGPARP